MREYLEAVEANFDGLVGPTHNYAGLASGNRASAQHASQRSDPRAAALEGLAKMRALAALGVPQGVLAPQERPHLPTLRALGFGGRDAEILYAVRRDAPELLAAASSASSMWSANAATVSPGADTSDGRVHFTTANLASHLHRALEPQTTSRILKATFAGTAHFAHHAPLPATPETADEGAANHTRLCVGYGAPGLELFVYGRDAADADAPAESGTAQVVARQTRAAGEAVARLHGLAAARTRFIRQSARAIDAGAFHNDVVAVGNRQLLLHHEYAFDDNAALHDALDGTLGADAAIRVECIRESELSLADAVSSYLFNSQLVHPPGGGTWLICARECEENPRAWNTITRLLADPAIDIDQVRVFDLRQSMHNGGGPACLRLRVVLDPAQQAAVHPRSWITPERGAELAAWVQRHYRDRLLLDDLADPQLLDESRTALDRLTQILDLGSLYEFQR